MKKTEGKSNNNRGKTLSQSEHDIILMLSESKIIQGQIVDKLARIVCDQRDLTTAVQALTEHVGKLNVECGYERHQGEG